MWTFTIDPTLFESPRHAYRYLRDKRCISETMRRLKRLGHLNTGRYFYVVEWQKKTEMPHFHVLADTNFIPFSVVCETWNAFRPVEAGPVEGDRPGFGSVRFSAPKFHDGKHAANYACKYLTKHPEQGYPAWVMEEKGTQVHRYSTSRGFWGATDEAPPALPAVEDDEPEDEVIAVQRSIGERVARCESSSVLVTVFDEIDESTGELLTRRKWLAALVVPFSDIRDLLGLGDSIRRSELPPEMVQGLVYAFGKDRPPPSAWN